MAPDKNGEQEDRPGLGSFFLPEKQSLQKDQLNHPLAFTVLVTYRRHCKHIFKNEENLPMTKEKVDDNQSTVGLVLSRGANYFSYFRNR